MPSVTETLLAGNSQMQAVLDAGIDSISAKQRVVFTLYRKFVFSVDGSVFWVATPTTLTVVGALHYASDRMQNEDETLSQNFVLLSAEQEVTDFNRTAPNTLWIGDWPLVPSYADTLSGGLTTETGTGIEAEGGQPLLPDAPIPTLQVAFSQRGQFFPPAKVYHYSGFAVFPALSTQIVQSADDIPQGPIVSNSLPIWISLAPVNVPVYPSYLVPDNIVPPYIVAHIEPSQTETLQAAPVLVWPGTVIPDSGGSPLHDLGLSQLLRDEVDLTLYGFTALQAAQYLWSLLDASLTIESFGFANSPAVRDAKRVQTEIATIAQKKTIHVSTNYYLNVASGVARRLLLEALVHEVFTPGGIAPEGQGGTYQAEQIVAAVGLVSASPEGEGWTVQEVQTVSATGTTEE